MRQIAVIGLGRFGTAVCEEIYNDGGEVLAIDQSEERIQEIIQNKQATHAVQIDATNKNALISVGIADFEAVVVSMASSIQDSILTTLLLKEIGVSKIIAKASSTAHGVVLEKIGATQVIFPEREMGKRIAKSLITGAKDVVGIAPDLSIFELQVEKKFIGKTLLELELRKKYYVNVLAIKRGTETISEINPQEVILKGDNLIVIGKEENIKKIAR